MYTTICISLYLLLDIQLVSRLGLRWIKFPWSYVNKSFVKLHIFLSLGSTHWHRSSGSYAEFISLLGLPKQSTTTEWLKTIELYCPTVVKTRSPISSCCQALLPPESLGEDSSLLPSASGSPGSSPWLVITAMSAYVLTCHFLCFCMTFFSVCVYV